MKNGLSFFLQLYMNLIKFVSISNIVIWRKFFEPLIHVGVINFAALNKYSGHVFV